MHSAKKLYYVWFPTSEHFILTLDPLSATHSAYWHQKELIFVPQHEISNRLGYHSIFLFDERHLEFYKQYGSDWNGTQFPFYSNSLIIDIDQNGQHSVDILQEKFKDYDYLVYASGTEGHYHFVIPHNLITSSNIQMCYRAFLASAYVCCDPSIWQPIIGVPFPGTKHRTSGIPRTIVHVNEGKKLFFPEIVSINSMIEFGKSFFIGDK